MDTHIKRLATVLVDRAQEASAEDVASVVDAFVKELADLNILEQWREVEEAIHQIWKERYGVSKITILSAHPLSEQANEKIEELAKGAEIIRRIDERLIGGSIIRIDDKRIDGSIAGALKKLKLTLNK